MALCAGLMTMIYMLAPIDNQMMLVLGFPLGFFANGKRVVLYLAGTGFELRLAVER